MEKKNVNLNLFFLIFFFSHLSRGIKKIFFTWHTWRRHVEIPPSHQPWCAARGVTHGILTLQGGIYEEKKL
jgi:hypothetical protein